MQVNAETNKVLSELHVGDEIDVLQEDGVWQKEMIKRIRDDTIWTENGFKSESRLGLEFPVKIKNYGKDFALLHTHTFPITHLKDISISVCNGAPIYDPTNKSLIFPSNAFYSEIATYDTVTQKCKQFPLRIFGVRSDELYDINFDPTTKTLYLLQESKLIKLNIETTQIIQYHHELGPFDHAVEESFILSVFIPYPINEYHFLLDNIHFKFDESEKKIIQVNKINNFSTEQRKILYVKYLKKLYIFGGYDANHRRYDSILYCDILNDTPNYEWKQYHIPLPINITWKYETSSNCNVILAFDYIVFLLFDLEGCKYKLDSMIFAMDLLHGKIYQFKANKQLIFYDIDAVKVEDKLHIIGSGAHYKLSLSDIIPKKMRQFYVKYYQKIISGLLMEQKQYRFMFDLIMSYIGLFLEQ